MLSFVLLLAGCGGLDKTTGCDFRDATLVHPEDRCQERSGTQANGFDTMCDGLGGETVDGGCDREGVVAGCDMGGVAGDVVDWYYAPTTREEVEADCDGEGTVVDP